MPALALAALAPRYNRRPRVPGLSAFTTRTIPSVVAFVVLRSLCRVSITLAAVALVTSQLRDV